MVCRRVVCVRRRSSAGSSMMRYGASIGTSHSGEDGDVHAKQPVLARLAMVYADHPDFDARWTR